MAFHFMPFKILTSSEALKSVKVSMALVESMDTPENQKKLTDLTED
jgi:hypothetical protein